MTDDSVHYQASFFEDHAAGSARSASVVVPLILKLFDVKSVVDVGCGTGTWLREFERHGLDICGIDGDYVPRNQLAIAPERFEAQDLKSLKINRRYDLACCLEVGEHLPESNADALVSALVKAAPVVIFSAAIKQQHGENHINEQWQSYWARKFRSNGYFIFDCIRPAIFADQRIEPHYRQNILVYCESSKRPAGFNPINEPTDIDHVLSEYYFLHGVNGGGRVAKTGKQALAVIVDNARIIVRQLSKRLR